MPYKQISDDRFRTFLQNSSKYFSWDIILRDAGITEISDKGDQYEIACPFHEDWSPSMRLTKNNGVYHCFSCGRKGSYTKFLWELAGKQVPYAEFCEQILKSHPEMQAELKFNSLFNSADALDPEFEKRRVFDRNLHLGSAMPMTLLAKKVRSIEDSWDNLVLTLTLLQQGVTTDNILSTVQKRTIKMEKPKERVSILDII